MTGSTPTGAQGPRTARRQRLVAGLLVLLIALGATGWALLRSRASKQGEAAGSGGMAGMPGMESMPGMEGMPMGGGDGTVRLTGDQLRTFGVTFGAVERRPLTASIRTTGMVVVDETRIAQVSLKSDGVVERLHVGFTGQPVRKGQALLEVYSPALVAAQEELLVAVRLDREMAGSAVPGVPAGTSDLVASARRRLELQDVSRAQIDAILRTGSVRRTLTLYSPAGGVVTELAVRRGQAITAGTMLYTITALDRVWVEAAVRERDMAQVREGSTVAIDLAAYPGRTFEGRVEYIYPTVQQEARTLKARIAVPNPDGLLKPGMYATVRVETPSRDALTVPASAVIQTGERAIVFVDMGEGRLMPHDVELGRSAGEYQEILTGLEPGQRVVTSAQYLLESESNLGEIMKSAMAQMGMSDMGGMEDMEGMQAKPGIDTAPGMNDKGADMRGTPMPAGPR